MRATLLMLVLAAAAAHAQVHKCKGADGRTMYSDAPCPGGQRLDPSMLQGNTIAPVEAPREARPAVAPQRPAAGTCPSDQDIRNMETSASSMTLSRAEQLRAQAEIAAARRCRAGGDPTPDYSASQELERQRATRRAGPARALVNCDAAGCWDTTGARYTRAAGGNFYRADGAFCTPQAGGPVTCR